MNETAGPLSGADQGPDRPLMERLASQLASAEANRVAIDPLHSAHPRLSLGEAYAIQRINIERRVSAGARVVGHKVGLTSEAMRQQMGVDTPDCGVLLDDMRIPSGGTLRVDELVSPRVEAEIAFTLERDLLGPAISRHQVEEAVSEVFVALEVIDSRIQDWNIDLIDTVADNASSARFVVSQLTRPPGLLDLVSENVALLVDGQPVANGDGGAVMDHPLNAVAWLANQLQHAGTGLRAGDLVLAGSVHASLPLSAGTVVSAQSPHLGSVRLSVA